MYEVERKFLVKDDSWKQYVTESYEIVQVYISVDPKLTIRARHKTSSLNVNTYMLAFKGITENPMIRSEIETPIEYDTYRWFRGTTDYLPITKTRHIVPMDDKLMWEVDVFHGEHRGLVMAEVELDYVDQHIVIPDWIGEEVTNNTMYYNNNMVIPKINKTQITHTTNTNTKLMNVLDDPDLMLEYD